MAPGQAAHGGQVAGALAAGGPGPQARRWRERGGGRDQARAAGERRRERSARRPRRHKDPAPTSDLTLSGRGAPPQPPAPVPPPARGGRASGARSHLPQPGVPSRAPPRRLSQRQARWAPRLGPAAAAAPAATRGDGAAAAAPGGAGSGLGAARRRQVRAERGALCGGGAGTAVRAAPACARSATPRLGTRAGSAGRGQPGSRCPSIRRGPGARSRGHPSPAHRVRAPVLRRPSSAPTASPPGGPES